MDVQRLLFRRQFLLSSTPIQGLEHWKQASFQDFLLYIHPDLDHASLENTEASLNLAVLGFILHPDYPDFNNLQVLEELRQQVNSLDTLFEQLDRLTGRFVLLVHLNSQTYIFHDPFGLRTLYYGNYQGQFFAASQPTLLERSMPLEKGIKYKSYHNSKYKQEVVEHWLPTGCSLYENVGHLKPNHYLSVDSFKQVRYWPRKKLPRLKAEAAAQATASLLEKIILAAHHRFKLALPISAGYDSRTLLSACKSIAPDLFLYTMMYRSINETHEDIIIPANLLEQLGLKHHIIDCRQLINPKFSYIYKHSVDNAHLFDWGQIALGIFNNFPSDYVCLKGNGPEIGRCVNYVFGKHPPVHHPDQIIALEKGWEELDFIQDVIKKWFTEIQSISKATGYDLYDLFLWEHHLGSWQAQCQLEWDIAQATFSPFNHRRLVELVLGVHKKYRRKPYFTLYRKIIKKAWPDLLQSPINPDSLQKDRMKALLFRFGLLKSFRLLKRKLNK